MLEAKFYDSKGIIPRPGEDQQSYLKRATDTLEALQKFNQDVREKKFGPKGAEYEVVDNPIMRRYGFSELPFPNITLDSDEYRYLH